MRPILFRLLLTPPPRAHNVRSTSASGCFVLPPSDECPDLLGGERARSAIGCANYSIFEIEVARASPGGGPARGAATSSAGELISRCADGYSRPAVDLDNGADGGSMREIEMAVGGRVWADSYLGEIGFYIYLFAT